MEFPIRTSPFDSCTSRSTSVDVHRKCEGIPAAASRRCEGVDTIQYKVSSLFKLSQACLRVKKVEVGKRSAKARKIEEVKDRRTGRFHFPTWYFKMAHACANMLTAP
jgi:hypothetical protein